MNDSHALVRLVAAIALALPAALPAQQLYRSRSFVVTDSSVRQGQFEAVAVSRDTILSNYPRAAREVHFKFALDANESEFPPGTEHMITLRPHGGRVATPIYTFGIQEPKRLPRPEESAGGEEGNAEVTFRVDMRPVLRSFAALGYFDPHNGPRIQASQFRGVYVIGDVPPLTWDYHSLRPGSPLQLHDADGDSVYTLTLPIETQYTRPLAADGRAIWARQASLAGFPELTSPQRILDAVYRLSLEELTQLVRPDSALSAGAKWPGVWTRDVSLSTILAIAMVAPDATRRSLMAKVDSTGRIIQDTGTGGSWPISTDRMVWALAAWELYASTGDRAWLRTSYDIIRRSAAADLHAAVDLRTGLVHGESSFLDWREQSYPRWMDPKDIYTSQALGTNVVHYAAYRVLGQMARALGEPSAKWDAVADSLGRGINARLWQEDRGWYGQYLYGRNWLSLSPRAEGLGEALAIIQGVAPRTRRERLARAMPVTEFGEPSFWPYIPDMPLYHNAAIWPFVTAYWTWAQADVGNTSGVELGLADNVRAAALFLTNKENMAAETGHFEGTVLNSDRQLWSVAGTLASTYRVLFGMRPLADRLVLRPMVPRSYAGTRTLRDFRYRGARLTVTMHGFGEGVASAKLDGRAIARAEVPATLTGAHTLELTLDGRWPAGAMNLVANRYAPETPVASLRGQELVWRPVQGAVRYVVYRDGRAVDTTAAFRVPVQRADGLVEYQLLALDSAGVQSFLGEPVRVVSEDAVLTAKPHGELEQESAGFSGSGYLPLTAQQNTTVEIPVRVARAGTYAIDVRYANGNGPINTDAKAAVRTLDVDGRERGVLVMPQRGVDLWTDWGYSNALHVRLGAGAHTLVLRYTPLDRNMNGVVSTALLDAVRLTRLGEGR